MKRLVFFFFSTSSCFSFILISITSLRLVVMGVCVLFMFLCVSSVHLGVFCSSLVKVSFLHYLQYRWFVIIYLKCKYVNFCPIFAILQRQHVKLGCLLISEHCFHFFLYPLRHSHHHHRNHHK